MVTRAEALDELRAIRVRLDQIAAVLTGEATREELGVRWSCGHHHPHRQAALDCLRAQKALASGETLGNAG